MEIEVRPTKDLDRWDRNIDSIDASPFLGSRYLEAFRSDLLEPVYLEFLTGDGWVGGISGLIINPSFKVVKKVGMFRTLIFFSGPWTGDRGAEQEALGSLVNYLKKEGFVSFLMMEYDYPFPIEGLDETYQLRKHHEYFISLEGDWESIRRGVKRRIKDKYNRAKRNGLTFEMDTRPERIDTLFSLLDDTAENRSERGFSDFNMAPVPHMTKDVIKKHMENGLARVAYARSADEIVSMQLIIAQGRRAYALFIGTNPNGYNLGANAMVFVETMNRLHSEGFKTYNIGGTPKVGKEGLEFFKIGLGAEKVECRGLGSPFLQGPVLKRISELYRKVR